MPFRKFRPLTLSLSLFVLFLLACDLGSLTGSKPTVVISSPPSGSQYRDGEDVAVQSTSIDSTGVVRLELLVDGNVVRTDAVPAPQISYSLIQTWKATPGTHTLSVRAYNTSNTASDPAAITIMVLPATGTATTPVVPTVVGLEPSSAAATPTLAPGACTNALQFVADVTIPDGMVLAAGQTFAKVWRVKNTGTCAWDNSYQFFHAGGEAMTTTTLVAVPVTPAGATADLVIPMTAPAAAGNHAGQWRVKSPTGAVFGPALTVNITVPGAPTPTATATTPPSGCSGAPVIASFTAVTTTLNLGQSTTLQWGLVSNANSAEIDHDIGGVGTPGNMTVAPTTTTTYTMTARCGSNVATRSLTITVNTSGVLYDFVANAPSAVWTSGAGTTTTGTLTWGDSANINGTNDQGFMRWVDYTVLEDNTTVTRALETHPKWVDNGFITGQYTVNIPIPTGTHFRAKYGFIKGASGRVAFVAGVIMGSLSTRLISDTKTATGNLVSVDVDLSAYAGQTVRFYLQAIAANPSATQDWAVWVAPRFEK